MSPLPPEIPDREIGYAALHLAAQSGIRAQILIRYRPETGFCLAWCNRLATELFSLPALDGAIPPLPWEEIPAPLAAYLSEALSKATQDAEQTLDPYVSNSEERERYQVHLYYLEVPSAERIGDELDPTRYYLLAFHNLAMWSTDGQASLETQKLESIGELASGVAHDFNNLIMGIQANAEALLSREPASPESQNLIVNIIRACSTGTSLTRSLLGYAKRQPLTIARFDLVEMAKDITNIARLSLARGHHRLVLDPRLREGQPPILIDGCYSSLSHCLINLIKNAREAMPNGGDIELLYAGDEKQARIVVRDRGKGIPEEELPKIFEPFFSTKKQGTGLGLPMVRGIMSQHSGGVEVSSSLGAGTEITLVWPRNLLGEAAQPARPALDPRRSTGSIMKAVQASAADEHPLAFVVDDDELVRGGVQGLLEHLHYRVQCFPSAEEAIVAINLDDLPALILVDFNMPGMDGTEFIRYWCEELPEAYREKSTRILLVSGFPPSQFQSLINKYAGMNVGLLQKPFSLQTLQRKLRDFSSLRSITGRIKPPNPRPSGPVKARVKVRPNQP